MLSFLFLLKLLFFSFRSSGFVAWSSRCPPSHRHQNPEVALCSLPAEIPHLPFIKKPLFSFWKFLWQTPVSLIMQSSPHKLPWSTSLKIKHWRSSPQKTFSGQNENLTKFLSSLRFWDAVELNEAPWRVLWWTEHGGLHGLFKTFLVFFITATVPRSERMKLSQQFHITKLRKRLIKKGKEGGRGGENAPNNYFYCFRSICVLQNS